MSISRTKIIDIVILPPGDEDDEDDGEEDSTIEGSLEN